MATTTNYGWTTPDDTALVKDGAAAIRTLGSSVDTTTKNLNPETTLGDLAYRSSTANVKTRLALGTANQQLRVNSSATAPEWFTPTAAASGLTLINRSTFSNVASHAVDNVFTSSYKSYVIKIEGLFGASGGSMSFNFRYGGASGTTATEATHYGYRSKGIYNDNSWAVGASFNGLTSLPIGDSCGTSTYPFHSTVDVFNVGNTSQVTTITFASNMAGGSGGIAVGGGTLYEQRNYTGFLLTGGSNITGAVAVYGYGV